MQHKWSCMGPPSCNREKERQDIMEHVEERYGALEVHANRCSVNADSMHKRLEHGKPARFTREDALLEVDLLRPMAAIPACRWTASESMSSLPHVARVDTLHTSILLRWQHWIIR